MASINIKNTTQSLSNAVNYEGTPAEVPTDKYKLLLRQACSCMLFEPTYYASGTEIAKEISATAMELPYQRIVEAALHISEHFKLRGISTYLLANAIVRREQRPHTVMGLSEPIEDAAKIILQRPDMLTELFVMYQQLAGQDKTFPKVLFRIARERMNAYSVYQLAKYSTKGGLTLRDILRITRVTPKDEQRAEVFKALVKQTITVPETWEKRLSAGQDKLAVWTEMLVDGTLGGIAILKNLRNMMSVNVNPELIRTALGKSELFRGALLTQILAANQHSNGVFQGELQALLQVAEFPKLDGHTIFLVDVSRSMNNPLAAGSDLLLMNAAAFLAAIGAGCSQSAEVYSFSTNLVPCPNHSNYPFQFAQEIVKSQKHDGTNLREALTQIYSSCKFDRLIVLTDEQAHALPPAAIQGRSYIINVAPYKAGIQQNLGYHRIDGFSPRVLQFVAQQEAL